MRVLIINKFAHITGGADAHCLQLARALTAAGHAIAILAAAAPGADVALDDTWDRELVPATVTHASRDSTKGRERVAIATQAMWHSAAARATRSLLDRFQPDIVHAHKLYPQLSVAPIIVASRRRIPIVQTIHDYEFIAAGGRDDRPTWLDRRETRVSYSFLNTLLLAVRRSLHLRRVNTWIAVSRHVAAAYERGGIRAMVVPNFVPTPSLDSSELEFEARNGLGFIGRLVPEKGIEDVLAVARLVPRIRVVIAGAGPLRSTVERAAAELPNLKYVGPVDAARVAQLLRTVRAALISSRWAEPGPIIALEAMAAGTPVVAYSTGGLGEYVSDAGGGVAVPVNIEALASAARQVHNDSELWRQLSSAARAAALRDHSPGRYLEQLEPIYRQATGWGPTRHLDRRAPAAESR